MPLYLNQAILLAVVAGRQPERVLDLGCGEGWLLRALAERAINVVGVDGDATLVEAARAAGSSPVHLATYEELAEAKVEIGSDYDLICANFALLHQDIIPTRRHERPARPRRRTGDPDAASVECSGGRLSGWLAARDLHRVQGTVAAHAVVLPPLVQLAQRAGHGRLSADQPARATAPAKSCAAVVVGGG